MVEMSFKSILESEAYSKQKTLVQNELNAGDKEGRYFVTRDFKAPHAKEFKHQVAELEKLAEMKKAWKKRMIERWGSTWSKRTASRKYGEFHNRMN